MRPRNYKCASQQWGRFSSISKTLLSVRRSSCGKLLTPGTLPFPLASPQQKKEKEGGRETLLSGTGERGKAVSEAARSAHQPAGFYVISE